MRWLFNLIANLFSTRQAATKKRHLMGMYLNESNSRGRRKPNRERA
jgi:hypothetical protein